ncbi:unnamed protein product [Auanema sp. JU1783]|nr:unnamed protein product [Auanema sp. JU1783]
MLLRYGKQLYILKKADVLGVNVWRQASSNASSERQKNEQLSLVHIEQQFESVPNVERNKKSFMAAIYMFKEKKSRGHVEFINAALKFVKEYGVHKDIDTYKSLLNIFPKGKMIPQTTFQKIFLHYPMQQNCCVKVLDEMEWHGVSPDKEIHDIVVNAFGEWNFATKKVKRMIYWMPKLKHTNKYVDRRHLEGKTLSPEELAGLALKTICRDPGTQFSLYKGLNQSDWIASAQSRSQNELISRLPTDSDICVDGPFKVYLMEHVLHYVMLTAPSQTQSVSDFSEDKDISDNWFSDWKSRNHTKKRTIHEQSAETILGIAILNKNDNATAAWWVEELEKRNNHIASLRLRLRLDR